MYQRRTETIRLAFQGRAKIKNTEIVGNSRPVLFGCFYSIVLLSCSLVGGAVLPPHAYFYSTLSYAELPNISARSCALLAALQPVRGVDPSGLKLPTQDLESIL